jgi:SAM-dependent methyltransferase
MSGSKEHYKKLLNDRSGTKFASCGYSDRFDPFILGDLEPIRGLYDGLFRSFLSDINCGKLLDVGCGTGIYFKLLAQYADEIEALDNSEDMLSVARQYCQKEGLKNIRLKMGSAESLPYEDGLFDVVISLDLLHHVPDIDRTLGEVHRVLKNGGHFLVFEPNICNPMMFLAHAVPSEERLAMSRNSPKKLLALLERRFESVRWNGICELVTQTTGIKRLILDLYLRMWRISRLQVFYPRQAWLGKKV